MTGFLFTLSIIYKGRWYVYRRLSPAKGTLPDVMKKQAAWFIPRRPVYFGSGQLLYSEAAGFFSKRPPTLFSKQAVFYESGQLFLKAAACIIFEAVSFFSKWPPTLFRRGQLSMKVSGFLLRLSAAEAFAAQESIVPSGMSRSDDWTMAQSF